MSYLQTMARLEKCRENLNRGIDEAWVRERKCETEHARAFEAGTACGLGVALGMINKEIRELKRGVSA